MAAIDEGFQLLIKNVQDANSQFLNMYSKIAHRFSVSDGFELQWNDQFWQHFCVDHLHAFPKAEPTGREGRDGCENRNTRTSKISIKYLKQFSAVRSKSLFGLMSN